MACDGRPRNPTASCGAIGYDAARNLFFNPDASFDAADAGPATVTLAFTVRKPTRVRGKLRRVTRLTRRRTVRYSSTARMRGRVTTPTGVPIVQARVYRATSVAGGPWKLATKPLITSKTGRVSFASGHTERRTDKEYLIAVGTRH